MAKPRWRIGAITIACILLITFPLWSQYPIYHLPLYYIGITVLIGYVIFTHRRQTCEAARRRFVQHWERQRLRGFWKHAGSASLRSLGLMVSVLSFIQFTVYGRDPLTLVARLVDTGFVWPPLLILILFSLLSGVASWYENENKYTGSKFFG